MRIAAGAARDPGTQSGPSLPADANKEDAALASSTQHGEHWPSRGRAQASGYVGEGVRCTPSVMLLCEFAGSLSAIDEAAGAQ